MFNVITNNTNSDYYEKSTTRKKMTKKLASTSSAIGDLEHLVNCAICSNELCEPTTMSCGHSFCRVCTINWCFVYKNYNCPICRCPLADKTLPSVNLTLKYLIALVKERNLGGASSFEVSGKSAAVFDHERLMSKIMKDLGETKAAPRQTTVNNSNSNNQGHDNDNNNQPECRLDHENNNKNSFKRSSSCMSLPNRKSYSTSDSTLTRLNLVYFPFYLWLTVCGFVFLGFLNIVKRIMAR